MIYAMALALGVATASPSSPAPSVGEPGAHAVVPLAQATWTAAPSFDDLARAYPARAHGDGKVVLRCVFTVRGVVEDCETLAEAPPGMGFADTARSLIHEFRLDVPPDFSKGAASVQMIVPFLLPDPRTAAFRERHVGEPRWLTGPDAVDMAKVYPAQAAARGVTTGLGMAKCTVGGDGGLWECTPLPGQPEGLGFSEAAVQIAQVLRMNLWTEDGGPVAGAIIRLPIRFDLAPGQAVASGAASSSQGTRAVPGEAPPSWAKAPSGSDIAAHYPRAALRNATSGGAVLECGVDHLGHLTACRVTSEFPPKAGFGRAALQLAPLFKLKPKTRTGQSVGGGTIHIPIRFVAKRPGG